METGGVALECTLFYLQNDAAYTVRVYVRSPRGWQTSPNVKATATPKAFIYADSLPVGAAINMTIGGVKTIHYIANIGYESYSDMMVLIVKNAGNFNKSPYEVQAYLNSTVINQYDRGSIIPSVNVIIEMYVSGGGNSRHDAVLKLFLPSVKEISASAGWVGTQLQFFKNENFYKLLTSAHAQSPTRSSGSGIMYFLNVGTATAGGRGGDLSYPFPAIYAFCIPRKTKLAPVPNADGSYNLL